MNATDWLVTASASFVGTVLIVLTAGWWWRRTKRRLAEHEAERQRILAEHEAALQRIAERHEALQHFGQVSRMNPFDPVAHRRTVDFRDFRERVPAPAAPPVLAKQKPVAKPTPQPEEPSRTYREEDDVLIRLPSLLWSASLPDPAPADSTSWSGGGGESGGGGASGSWDSPSSDSSGNSSGGGSGGDS